MRAWQLVRPRQFIEIEIDPPQVGEGQILVRLERAVICGSDVPKFAGTKIGLDYPLPPGMPIHECAGTVAASRSPAYEPGDPIVALPLGDRGLAEFFLADAAGAVRVPPSLLGSDLTPLIQPLSTVIYAVDKLGEVSGRTAIVVGLGPIGLLVTWLLRRLGAGRITGVDPIAPRCEAARGLGAAQALAAGSRHLVQAGPAAATWQAADICVEAVGHQPQTINDCLHLVRREGTVLALGVPEGPIYPFDYNRFFRQNIHLIASVTPPNNSYMQRAADLIAQHAPELACLVTHRFPLEAVAQAFALYEAPAEGRSLKVLLDATS